jgi:ABC-type antimicrobial peptide transport system permease subunit
MFGFTVANRADEITGFVISMIVILAVMSICMFFIMLSSMMYRIKEIGIYRAIGVSKRNLIFRFAIESFVLTALTVVVGYFITSGYIWLCIAVSPMVETIFFYPPWYSLIVLAFLVIVSILSGILPMMSLLRKTPSEILAKYDI